MRIPGIIGARAFFIIQNHQQFFEGKHGLEILTAIVNLPEGGLVLYGGVILGAISYYVFCIRRKISPLVLADLITPSIFIGLIFGRLGCFLNGRCCYGDPLHTALGGRVSSGNAAMAYLFGSRSRTNQPARTHSTYQTVPASDTDFHKRAFDGDDFSDFDVELLSVPTP